MISGGGGVRNLMASHPQGSFQILILQPCNHHSFKWSQGWVRKYSSQTFFNHSYFFSAADGWNEVGPWKRGSPSGDRLGRNLANVHKVVKVERELGRLSKGQAFLSKTREFPARSLPECEQKGAKLIPGIDDGHFIWTFIDWPQSWPQFGQEIRYLPVGSARGGLATESSVVSAKRTFKNAVLWIVQPYFVKFSYFVTSSWPKVMCNVQGYCSPTLSSVLNSCQMHCLFLNPLRIAVHRAETRYIGRGANFCILIGAPR